MHTAADTPMAADARWAWLVPAGALAAAMLPMAVTPVLPAIDLYNHIVRYLVLARLDHDPVLAANYAANWGLLPNIGLDVIAVALMQMVPAPWVPHVLVMLIFAALLGGVMVFNRAVAARPSPLVAVLAVPLLYSWVLNWGFANFLFGLGLAFIAAGMWWQMRGRRWRGLMIAVPAAVLIFLCHGVAFALYGLLIASLELGHWRQSRPRRPAALLAGLWPCAVQAVLPAALFMASQTAQAAEGVSSAGSSLVRLWQTGTLLPEVQRIIVYRLETIIRVAEGPSYALDAAWLAVMALCIAVLARQRLISLPLLVRPAIAAAVVLVILCPPALFGVGSIADRMPLFLALLLVSSLQVAPRAVLWHPAMIGIGALVAIRLASIAFVWQGIATDVADLDRVAARLPSNRLVAAINLDWSRHQDAASRCDNYLHVMALRHPSLVPVFANRTQQPIALAGRLERAVAVSTAAPAPLARTASALADRFAHAGFDYVLACQAAPGRPLPALAYRVVARSGRFAVLQLQPGGADAPR